MDKSDENFLVRTDWNTYNEHPEIECCIYCGEELEKLNVVHYAFNKETYDTYIIAVNPKVMQDLSVKEGYVRRVELVCDACMNDELRVID